MIIIIIIIVVVVVMVFTTQRHGGQESVQPDKKTNVAHEEIPSLEGSSVWTKLWVAPCSPMRSSYGVECEGVHASSIWGQGSNRTVVVVDVDCRVVVVLVVVVTRIIPVLSLVVVPKLRESLLSRSFIRPVVGADPRQVSKSDQRVPMSATMGPPPRSKPER
ncbi:hypothetical protein L228DRAFT_235440 [Xylona heveae TC161]|uniref:Uncharacterized protein n=1 Tax=Xylona heveae (strain CBS 132557 / TC161) TaxID=1328760 RepID=A0A165JKP4_XYLHT|nr:hypothetical protein L228DRAFT_235440 [Xylona heveae TC161]KZF26357.1 hypothetical protein L228DRAFT_235440 [Xylona heveae TC161]